MRRISVLAGVDVLLVACGGGISDPTLEEIQELYGSDGEVQFIESIRDDTIQGSDVKVVRYVVEDRNGRVLDCGAYFSLNARDEWVVSNRDCEEIGDANVGSQVTVQGSNLPLFDDPENDPAVGQQAPSLVGEGLSGDRVAVEPGGPAKIVIFFAQWSDLSMIDVEAIQGLVDSGAVPDEAVDLKAVQKVNDPERGTFGTLLEDMGWSVETLLDDEDGAAQRLASRECLSTSAGQATMKSFPSFGWSRERRGVRHNNVQGDQHNGTLVVTTGDIVPSGMVRMVEPSE